MAPGSCAVCGDVNLTARLSFVHPHGSCPHQSSEPFLAPPCGEKVDAIDLDEINREASEQETACSKETGGKCPECSARMMAKARDGTVYCRNCGVITSTGRLLLVKRAE